MSPLTCLPPLPPPQKTQNSADIKYGSLLEIDETLKKMRSSGPKAGEAMLVEEVGPEEIAGVVSKWTGARKCVFGGGGSGR